MITSRALALAAAAATCCPALLLPQGASANGCGVPFEGTTYLVGNPTDLNRMSAGCDLSWNVRITADIDLSASGPFTPIGAQSNTFRGTFDGGGHTISGLQIGAHAENGVGLLGTLSGATVRNLVVQGTVSDTSRFYVGLVAGNATNTTISNVRAIGTVEARGVAGGIVGSLGGTSTITDSSTDVTVSLANGSGSGAGGVVGTLEGTAARVSSAGSVQADTTGVAGGITGIALGATIASATSNASVRGGTAAGIAGVANAAGARPSSITDSHAMGAIGGGAGADGALGGIVGNSCVEGPASIVHTYFTGTLTPDAGATPATGGTVGGSRPCVAAVAAPATVAGNVWNSDTTGAAGAASGVGLGRTTAQMKELATYTALGWSIVNGWEPAGSSTWGICPQANGGYPFLQTSGLAVACRAPAEAVTTAPVLSATVLPSRRRLASGQSMRIGIRARNTGTGAAEAVTSCLRLPSNMVIRRAPGALRSGRTVCFRLGQVPAGTVRTKVVTVRAVATRRVVRTIRGTARATGLARVAAAPKRVVIRPRVVRARVTG